MTTNIIEIEATLREDGTLVLDEKPNLPPGRMRVTVQPVVDVTQTAVWRVTQQIWAEQRASGHMPRSKDEIDAAITTLRDEDEERMQAIETLQQECREARHRKADPRN